MFCTSFPSPPTSLCPSLPFRLSPSRKFMIPQNTPTLSFVSTSDPDFLDAPLSVRTLARHYEGLGYCNFWWNEKYGLYADAPDAHLEDDRVLLSPVIVT